jgi:probable F420-dependent oxidoreductase
VQVSVVSPVLWTIPGAHADWEVAAGVDEVVRVARAADRFGYHHLTCGEHVALPSSEAGRRGSRYWDPLATFGYLAACTERIRLATTVLVLGYHHPLAIAKRFGTLDTLSGGRLILGVGVGTLAEEFQLLGAPFEDRGPRTDDAIRALRASLSERLPAYHGPYYSFEGMVVDPCAVQRKVPIWVGGRSFRALRRAATLADGWCPRGVPLDVARSWLARIERSDNFEVVMPPARAFDPVGAAAMTQDALAEMVEAGVTIVAAQFIHHSLAHYLEQLEALAALKTHVV